jgi:hypothetical protein
MCLPSDAAPIHRASSNHSKIMKELIADDLQDELGDKRAPGKESSGGWARIITAFTLAILPVIFFYPVVLGKGILAPGDAWNLILGNRILIGEMIRNGELPLWNPYLFGGMPLLAAIVSGAFYPSTWLFTIFSPIAAMQR